MLKKRLCFLQDIRSLCVMYTLWKILNSNAGRRTLAAQTVGNSWNGWGNTIQALRYWNYISSLKHLRKSVTYTSVCVKAVYGTICIQSQRHLSTGTHFPWTLVTVLRLWLENRAQLRIVYWVSSLGHSTKKWSSCSGIRQQREDPLAVKSGMLRNYPNYQ